MNGNDHKRTIHLIRNLRTALIAIAIAVLTSTSSFAQDEYRLDVGGYGSFRLDTHDGDEGEPAFTMRRFVVTTDARLGQRFQVYSEVEYERLTEIEVERAVEREEGGIEFEQELEGTNASEIALEQAWAQFNLTDEVGLRFGAILPPVGRFNLYHDDNLWNFAHRPLADRAAQVLPASAAWTEMGLGIVGAHDFDSGMRLSYEGYVLTGTTLDFAIEEKVVTRVPQRNKLVLESVVSPTSGAFDGSNAADAVAARVAISPTLGSEIAVSGYSGKYTPNFLDEEASMYTLGIDGRQRIGTFYVEGEFLFTHYGDTDLVAENFAQAAVDHATETESDEAAELETEIEVELDGLAERRNGFWIDLSRPIALERGTWGLDEATVIPTIRYERVWIRDAITELEFSNGAIDALEREDIQQDRLSIGVAFRPLPQAVFQLVYMRSNPIDGALIEPEVESDGDAVNAVTFGLAVGF